MITVRIVHDDDPMSPREWDNLGVMACWHRRYNLGDIQPKETPDEWLASQPKGSIILPLYLYDHSGITMRTSAFSCQWDSGQVGWIVATPDKIKECYGVKRITKKIRERVEACLIAEVKTYDHYLTGNVWGFIIEDVVEDESLGYAIDKGNSCFGFFGDTLEETGMLGEVSQEYRELVAKAWDERFGTY